MVFGAGYAGADDVVGHELTHGYVEHTSGLFSLHQSGAINESVADTIGEIVDHRNPLSPATTPAGPSARTCRAAAIRSLKDPTHPSPQQPRPDDEPDYSVGRHLRRQRRRAPQRRRRQQDGLPDLAGRHLQRPAPITGIDGERHRPHQDRPALPRGDPAAHLRRAVRRPRSHPGRHLRRASPGTAPTASRPPTATRCARRSPPPSSSSAPTDPRRCNHEAPSTCADRHSPGRAAPRRRQRRSSSASPPAACGSARRPTAAPRTPAAGSSSLFGWDPDPTSTAISTSQIDQLRVHAAGRAAVVPALPPRLRHGVTATGTPAIYYDGGAGLRADAERRHVDDADGSRGSTARQDAGAAPRRRSSAATAAATAPAR